jgi:hypothetical protein
LRTQHGPAPITERDPVMVPAWHRIDSARLIRLGSVLVATPSSSGSASMRRRGTDVLRRRMDGATGALKTRWRGRAGRERVAAWRRTGPDRRRMRASARC